MTEEYREDYILYFGTPLEDLEAHALTDTLTAVTTAIEEINQSLATGKDISIRVRPFERGSFEIPFELIEFFIVGVLSDPRFPSIPEIIRILKEFIEIKILLKGQPPQNVDARGEKLALTTVDGDVVKVDRVAGDLIINNVQINNSFNRGMSRLSEDDSVERLELQNSNRERLVAVDSDAFKYFGPPSEISEDGKKVREVRAVLHVRKIVFDFTSKWGFYYDGVKISAKILDREFLEGAQTEGRFGNGDALDVTLRIHQEFDRSVNTFVNKAYEVVDVFKHTPRPKDQELFGT